MSDPPSVPPPSEPPPKPPLMQRARAWLGGAPSQKPNTPTPNTPNRDVVIADIGNSASNVVVGKNNVQINVGGRLMTLPIWLIVVALLALVAIFAIPFVEPILFPTQMSGGMNIAIADFGQMDENGRIHASALASAFSRNVYEKLIQEYQEVYPELIGKDGRTVEIWHDSQEDGEKNVRLGLINGATADARATAAEELAGRINANIVIYGYLQETTSANGGQSSAQNSLHLDFYYAGETLRGEPDTVVGRHVLGEMLAFPDALASEPMAALEYLNRPLAVRARVLFWLTVALIFEVTDQQQRALSTLQEAQRSLAVSGGTDAEDKEGQALLSYFIGREAYWLREDDLAITSFNEALRLKPNYANAYMGLGALHYDRAQRFYTPNPIPPELAPCFSEQDVASGAQSLQEVSAEVDRSIAFLQQAIAIAPSSPWPPIESTARMILGNAYRLKGQSLLLDTQLADRSEQARPWFTRALTEFTTAENAFNGSGNNTPKQQQYLSWTHLGTGATYLLQAYAALVGVEKQEKEVATTMYQAAAELFQQAADECQLCLEEGKTVADLVYQRKVIRCGCELLQDRAQVAHAEALRMLEAQE